MSRLPSSLGACARSFFSFGSPRLLGLQLLAAIAARPFLGPPRASEALVVIAIAIYWPLQEWILHRYVLHMKPITLGGRTWVSRAVITHALHHENPVELGPTLLPTSTIALLVPIHVGGWLLLSPSLGFACTGVACLGAAALLYEWIHFLTHTAYKPRTRWFRDVKRRHMAHHMRDPMRWFAFTAPWLDDWLGTGDPRAS